MGSFECGTLAKGDQNHDFKMIDLLAMYTSTVPSVVACVFIFMCRKEKLHAHLEVVPSLVPAAGLL